MLCRVVREEDEINVDNFLSSPVRKQLSLLSIKLSGRLRIRREANGPKNLDKKFFGCFCLPFRKQLSPLSSIKPSGRLRIRREANGPKNFDKKSSVAQQKKSYESEANIFQFVFVERRHVFFCSNLNESVQKKGWVCIAYLTILAQRVVCAFDLWCKTCGVLKYFHKFAAD